MNAIRSFHDDGLVYDFEAQRVWTRQEAALIENCELYLQHPISTEAKELLAQLARVEGLIPSN